MSEVPKVRTHDVTALLIERRAGDERAVEQPLPLVHDEFLTDDSGGRASAPL